MTTLKLFLIIGVLAGGVAIGLEYAVAAITGSSVPGDRIARDVIFAFALSGLIAFMRLRSRAKPNSTK